ncbi:hypothetical protein [Candidatus Aalborgicola defluviihabitans]|uniref:hypothetical protein n=1 Tax=Candidatus Aalborgicola defluviihabitans TaxID=3386187 RepID=UPI001EC9D373|nr:hypothetical protein [Burkholderiales bacterium]
MSSSPGTLFLSALWGGAAASVFAPLLWPIVVLIEQGRISFSFLFALPSVAFIALLSGLVFSAIVGFPLLVLSQKARLPATLVIAIGALVSVFLFSALFSWPQSSWSLYAYVFTLGALWCSGRLENALTRRSSGLAYGKPLS